VSRPEPAPSEPTPSEPTPSEPTPSEPTLSGPALSEPARPEPAQHEPARPEPAGHEPAGPAGRRRTRWAERARRRVAATEPVVAVRFARRPPRPAWTPVGRWLNRHRLARRATRILASAALFLAALLVFPGTASALPGLGGCTTAPTPESPGQGMSGFFLSAPNPPPPPEDPFQSGAKTTPFEQYGLAGLSWYAYDLGCGGAARDPSGAISAWAARTLFIPAKAGVSALAAVSQAALEPSYLSAFDPLLQHLTDALNKAIFTPLAPLAVMLTGLLLMAQATRQRVSESTTAIGWCLLVTVMAAALFAWPVRAGHAADTVITTGVGVVSKGITGGDGPPGMQVANSLYGPFLYRMWLMGEFCDPDSPGAKAHGAEVLQAQALNWDESARARTDAQKITKAKQSAFDKAAGATKKDDPAAYECVAGHGSASLEASILADVGVLLMAPFLLIGGLILIAAYIIVRFSVIFAPALLTAGAFFPLRGVVVAAARVVAAAIFNAVLFTLSVLLVIRVDTAILDPATRLPAWLRLVLVGVVTVVMWYLTRPFRKLTTMITSGSMAAAMGDGNYESRRAGGFLRNWRRRDAPLVVNNSDDDTTVVVNNARLREEARGPVGVAAPRRSGRHREPPIAVEAMRMDGTGHGLPRAGGGSPALPAGAEAGLGEGRGARRTGVRGAAAELPAGSGTSAFRRSDTGRGGFATAGSGAAGGYGGRADSVPPGVHQPPLSPRARRVTRVAARHVDDGLFDASAGYRPAPEDDDRGYLHRVEVEVIDSEEIYRLYDPSRDRSTAGSGAWSR
jgi:hypothetical protein